jgi:hypothetical protein
MAILCLNETKAQMRSVVAALFERWHDDIAHQRYALASGERKEKSDDCTVYTLPATVWELEQFMADKSTNTHKWFGGDGRVDLRCFENDWAVYASQKNTRMFMDVSGLESVYSNLDFCYSPKSIHPNKHAKKNFFAWFDFCGNPSQERLDIITDRQNFVTNSVVFATFTCAWRKTETVQSDILDLATDMAGDEALCIVATDAVEAYINENTSNKVKCVVSMEYQAQKTPMMLLGFTNSRTEIETVRRMPFGPCLRYRLNRTPAPVQPSVIKELTPENKAALESDLRSKKFDGARELAEKYSITTQKVGATLTWLHRKEGHWVGGYR